jgi:hypothetical protein
MPIHQPLCNKLGEKKLQSATLCFCIFSDCKVNLNVIYFFAIIAEFNEQVFKLRFEKSLFSLHQPHLTTATSNFPQFLQRRENPPPPATPSRQITPKTDLAQIVVQAFLSKSTERLLTVARMAEGIDRQSPEVIDLSLRLQLENVTGKDPDLEHQGVDKGVLGCVHKVMILPNLPINSNHA